MVLQVVIEKFEDFKIVENRTLLKSVQCLYIYFCSLEGEKLQLTPARRLWGTLSSYGFLWMTAVIYYAGCFDRYCSVDAIDIFDQCSDIMCLGF